MWDDVDRHCDVSSSRTKRSRPRTLRDLLPAKKKKKMNLCVPFRTREGKEFPSRSRSIVSIIPITKLRVSTPLFYDFSSLVHYLVQIKFFLKRIEGSLEVEQKWKFASDWRRRRRRRFDRRVALEPATCSRETLRSHYLIVITGVERPIGREV